MPIFIEGQSRRGYGWWVTSLLALTVSFSGIGFWLWRDATHPARPFTGEWIAADGTTFVIGRLGDYEAADAVGGTWREKGRGALSGILMVTDDGDAPFGLLRSRPDMVTWRVSPDRKVLTLSIGPRVWLSGKRKTGR
jgi:hypothetical protein